MINEIERKFLVKELKDETKNSASSIKSIEQAYIGEGDNFIQRIRTSASFKNNSALLIGIPDNETAFLTIKEKKGGISRIEVETTIPFEQGLLLIDSEKEKIQKTRFVIPQVEFYQKEDIPEEIIKDTDKYGYKSLENGLYEKTLYWEIDVFKGDNEGLVLAEIEIDWEGQQFDIPDFIGEEVSHDRRYYNAELLKNPISKWKSKPKKNKP